MAPAHDVAVAGLGVMGAAAASALAGRGARVLGLDRHSPPHERGSSHGRSRIIREAYFEHPLYVPLVRRAYGLWRALERERGLPLLRETGLVSLGPAAGAVVGGARRSAREHRIEHEELTAAEVAARWPALRPPDGAAALYEARAGLLDPEACVQSLLHAATASGAELRRQEPVLGWTARGSGVEVRTKTGTHAAGALVVAAGPWAADLLPGLSLPLRVERRVVHWFSPARDPGALAAGRCPIVLWEHAPGRLFYCTPDLGHGVKAALHDEGGTTRPDDVRPPAPGEEERTRELLRQVLPAAGGALLDATTCLYTRTPDGHFVIDRHPAHPQVVIVSACSGHGFKFAPAIGELAADLALGGAPPRELAPFALGRLA